MCQHRGAPSSWRKGKIKTSHSVKIPSSILSSIPSSQVSRVHGDVLDQDPPRMRHSVTWEVTCSSDLFFLFCQSMAEEEETGKPPPFGPEGSTVLLPSRVDVNAPSNKGDLTDCQRGQARKWEGKMVVKTFLMGSGTLK